MSELAELAGGSWREHASLQSIIHQCAASRASSKRANRRQSSTSSQARGR
jgi:hypothetical protein